MIKKIINAMVISALLAVSISLAGCGSRKTEDQIKDREISETTEIENISVEIGYEMIGTAALVIPETKEDLEMFIQK